MKRVERAPRLGERIYAQLKQMIFDFELLPGDYFSEAEVAELTGASRTPVREALHRLHREGYVRVHFKSGWQVMPFDFEVFEELYEVRVTLESAAVDKLCALKQWPEALETLAHFWRTPPGERPQDMAVSEHDRAFHATLMTVAGNAEMARLHREVSERIHIIRRLDFTEAPRIEATFDEHAAILDAIAGHETSQASTLLTRHIEESRRAVRRITLHRLQKAQAHHRRNDSFLAVEAADHGTTSPSTKSTSRE